MTAPSVSGVAPAAPDPRDAALRKSAADLQGLFIQQLYKSMRESVPTEGGLVEKSQGEEVFSGLMDERLAADTGTRWQRGLGDAIYRALRQKAGLDSPAASPSHAAPAVPQASPARIP
jgi:flagellar protein FlgJ